MKILFCGDVMPGGVLPYQDVFLDNTLKVYLNSFDLRVGTLECAIGTNLQPAPEKLKENGGNNNICFARDEDFYRIKELGFDLMSLGNNHSFDLGEEGLINTIRLLQKVASGFLVQEEILQKPPLQQYFSLEELRFVLLDVVSKD